MSWVSPFSLPGSWYKGNLHAHTDQSDGLLTPEKAAEWYQKHGYDFLAISDHWVLTPGRTFESGNDFITITGTELHGSTYDMLALGLSDLPDRGLAESPQATVDAVLSLGGLPFFAHSYWLGNTSADIAPIRGLMGLEVFNSVCEKQNGTGYAQVHWDELLSQGLRLTGLAVDDVHWRYGAEGHGFIMVRADALDESTILDAIRNGHFYASTGPKIDDLCVVQLGEGQAGLRVHSSPCSTITFHASGWRGRLFEAPRGETLDTAVHPLDIEQVYLRVECRDASGGIAWSNPVYVQDVLHEE